MSFTKLINKDGSSILIDNSINDWKDFVDCDTKEIVLNYTYEDENPGIDESGIHLTEEQNERLDIIRNQMIADMDEDDLNNRDYPEDYLEEYPYE